VFNVGPEELLLILVLALIVFGPKRLPEIGRTIGKSLREFRRASEGVREEINRHLNLHEDDQDDGFSGTFPVETTGRAADGDAGPAATTNDDRGVKPEERSLPEAGTGPAA
jgi:sec-independent protein translocase protein TatA